MCAHVLLGGNHAVLLWAVQHTLWAWSNRWEGEDLVCTASCGSCLAGSDSTAGNQLLESVSGVALEVKQQGKGLEQIPGAREAYKTRCITSKFLHKPTPSLRVYQDTWLARDF